MQRIPVTAARILEQRSHVVPGALKITEHVFEVPRDYSSPSAGTLRLFARSAHKNVTPIEPPSKENEGLPPYLLYLQGGPGNECRPPQSSPYTKSFLDKGYGLLFMDQRGTGLSSPITAATLKQQGNDQEQAKHLSFFRADNIVRDAEAIRLALTKGWPEQKSRFSLLGQSFGGFCCATYLSLFPDSLREAFVTGGLPPVALNNPDDVYRRLVRRVVRRNEAYYEKYPEDMFRVKHIVRHLNDNIVTLPDGARLTSQRFLGLGMGLGFHGMVDSIHDAVLRTMNDLDLFGVINRSTAGTITNSSGGFDTNPLYCLLHEPIYCQSGGATKWSAERMLREHPEFDVDKALQDEERKVFFTGEMVFPWMLDCYSELQPMKGAAKLISEKDDWPALYDIDTLKSNTVPVYAAVYTEDMYVDFDLAMETARIIKGTKYFLTNRIYHDGLRSKMDTVVESLWKLRTDTID